MSRELLRLLRLNRPYVGRLTVALVALVVAIVTGLVIPLVIRDVVNEVLVRERSHVLLPLVGVIVLLALLRAVANYFRRNITGIVSVLIETDLRDRLFAHVQGQPISFHDEWETGQLLARATGDLNAIRQFMAFGLMFLVLVVGLVIGVLVELFLMDVWLGLVVLVFAPLLTFVAARFTGSAEPYVALGREQLGDVAALVEQSAGGIRVLKAFGREDRQLAQLQARATALMETDLKAVRIRAVYIPALALIPNLMLAATLGVGGWQVTRGALDVGAIVAAYQLLSLMNFPLRNVGWILAMLQQAIAASNRVHEILDTDPSITDAPNAKAVGRLDGRIELDHVTVRFPSTTQPALDDVSLIVEPGEIVALAGPSGSGQVGARLAVVAVPRPRRRRGSAGRASPAHVDPALGAQPGRRGLRRGRALLRDGAREHRVRQPAGVRGGDRSGSCRCRRRPVRQHPAGGLRHRGRRAGLRPVRRAATAHRAGPRARQQAARARARRPALGGRRAHRGRDRGQPCAGDARPHRGPHRSASIDAGDGRPDRRARPRTHHRDRDPRGAARTEPRYATLVSDADEKEANERRTTTTVDDIAEMVG